MTKKIISYLLIVLMLMTSVPVGAFSASDEVITESFTFEIVPDDTLGLSFSDGPSVSLFSNDSSYSGCFGNQLDGLAKEFYDAVTEYYAKDKNVTYYKHTLKETLIFDYDAEYQSMRDELYSIAQVVSDAFLYDHPEIFWVRYITITFSTLISKDKVTGKRTAKIKDVTFGAMEIYTDAKSKQEDFDKAVDEAVKEIIASVSDKTNRYELLKAAHDYVCNKAWYNSVSDIRVHNAEPIFTGDGGVVCEGYAKAFKIICDELDIPCVLVGGYAGENKISHMWNYAQLEDGKWYLVDATWDDQSSGIYDTYFLANANSEVFFGAILSEERTERTDFSGKGYKSFIYPELSKTAHNAHSHVWDTEFTVDLEPTCTESGSKSNHCSVSGCNAKINITSVPATNHKNRTEYEQQNSTCNETGYTEGVYCTDCGTWLSGHEEIPALGHEFKAYVSDNNATCAKDGTKTAKCERCDATDSVADSGTRLEHTWGGWTVESAATCTAGGFEKRNCENCSASEVRSTEATNHANSYLTDATEPSCAEVGYEEGLYCPDCKIWISGHEEIPALGHIFSSYTSDNNASCTADGTKTAVCERCGETDTVADEGTKLDHDWGEWISVSVPSCTTGGVDKKSCKNCTASETKNVAPTNHANAYIVAAQSENCTETGFTEGLYCPDCTIWIYGREEIPSLGHNFESYISDNNATCTADGTKTAKCERCDETDTVTDENTKVAHEWGEWETYSKPTCTTDGIDTRFCKNCTEGEIRMIDSTNHANAYSVGADSPTCTEKGFSDGVYCPDCMIWLSMRSEIPALGHRFVLYTSDNNASCTADGTKTALCENCNETDTVTDNGTRLEHTWGEWSVAKEPSCLNAGTEARYCGVCEAPETKTIPATNHPDAYGVDGEAASCTATGYTDGRYCPDCEAWVSGHSLIQKLPHKFTEKIIDEAHLISAATVVDFAVYGYDCEDCDAISKTETFTYGERVPVGKTEKLTATQDTSSITLKWDAVDYAVKYKVYQKTSAGWKSLGNVTKATAKIKNLSAGTKYTFAVMAAAEIDGKIVWSKAYTTINTATQAPLPTTIKTKQTSSVIQLIWNACPGATGYRVYVLEGAEWIYQGQYKGTRAFFTKLEAGAKYTYAVRPYISLDDGSVVWSAYKTYTAATTPAAPSVTASSASKGKITLKWNAVSGAEAYQLFYKTGNGGYKLYKNYTGAQTVNFTNLKSGTKYTFAVRAAIKTSGGWIFGAYRPVRVTVK